MRNGLDPHIIARAHLQVRAFPDGDAEIWRGRGMSSSWGTGIDVPDPLYLAHFHRW